MSGGNRPGTFGSGESPGQVIRARVVANTAAVLPQYILDRYLSDLSRLLLGRIGAAGRVGYLDQKHGLPPLVRTAGKIRQFEEWRGMATVYSDVLQAPFGGYRPSANEEFMNADQLAYFRQKLLRWKDDILREAADTVAQLKDGPIQEADLNDRASSETDWSIHLRTRDRQRKLISKIDSALRRIDSGEYGFCEVTGEPISLARLEARPVATMTVEAQERHERNERVSRED